MRISPAFLALLSNLKGLLLSLLILFLLALLGLSLINSAPKIKRLKMLSVKADQVGISLGYYELGQRKGANSAAKKHLLIRKDPKSGWLFQNISSAKRVDAKTTKFNTRYIRRVALQKDDKLIFNTFTLLVKQADANQLVLYNQTYNENAVWNGSELLINAKSGYPSCERQGLRRVLGDISDDFHWLIRGYNPQKTLRLFSLGGQVHCTTRWKLSNLQPDSARIYWQNGKYWIGPGSVSTRILLERKTHQQDIKKLMLPVNDQKTNNGKVERIILGRTYYSVKSSEEKLQLIPVRNQQVFQVVDIENETDEDKREILLKAKDEENKRLTDMQAKGIKPVFVEHKWIGDSLKAAPLRKRSLILLAGLAVFGLSFAVTIYRWKRKAQGRASFVSILISTGITLLFSWAAVAWKGEISISLIILFTSSCWASLLLAFTGRLQKNTQKIWLVALLLAGIGTLTLTQLAAGANNTSWLRYAAVNIFILNQIICFIALLTLVPLPALNGLMLILLRSKNKIINALKAAVIFFVIFLLVMQFAIGSEQGIWGIQPVEIAKLLIVIIAAHALWHLKMLRSIHSRYYREKPMARILLFFWVLFAFLLISLLIAVGVHDYSPTLIVMALMAAFLWKAIPHPIRNTPVFTWLSRGILILLPLLILIGIGIKFYNNPPEYDSSIPQAERLRIWAKPAEHPEAAAQLLKSLDRVGRGGWTGENWFGSNKISMAIPAVQDDFIAAFLLNRFGGITGLLLIITQLFWIAILFKISDRLSQPQKNQALYASHNILGNILFGLAWIHLLHWLISWSNVLGLLPIMGQPMTWLSAGNSHLLAIGAVTLVLGLVGSWVSEVGE